MAPAAHFRKRPQACAILSAMDIMQTFDNAPIGVFDSGFGGLTVAREIAKALPEESIIYVGDSARCPYGPRSLSEVDGFVQQIGSWLVQRGVKLIVIACNTATAAGLAHAQQTFPVPVIGVVEPGARAAAHATRNKRVGVIATKATVESDAYTKAIRHLDAGITVFSTATPRFVEIAEQGIRMAEALSKLTPRLHRRSISDRRSRLSQKSIWSRCGAAKSIRSYLVAHIFRCSRR